MFNFDKATHTYTLDGKRMTGVTTILGIVAKPALIQWSADMATKYVRENLNHLDELENILKEARVAHRKKKEKAGDIGTEVHEAIEAWIKDKTEPQLDEKGMVMFNNFTNWATENKVKFLSTEQPIYSAKHFFAGTYDFTCEIDGKKYVGDLKTSSGIYYEYFMQVGAYRLMLEEMGQKDFHGSVIVRCGKDGSFEEVRRYDYESDRDAFLSALKIYRAKEDYKVSKK